MVGGIIVLNGVSSAGKSTLARAVQGALPVPWLVLGVDDLVAAAPAGMVEIGLAGEVLVGAGFAALDHAWACGVAAMAKAGVGVILDVVLLDGGVAQRRLQASLGEARVFWVGVKCDAEIAEARELARGDRVVGMARRQMAMVHAGIAYDVEVDTSSGTPQHCAQQLLAALDSWQ